MSDADPHQQRFELVEAQYRRADGALKQAQAKYDPWQAVSPAKAAGGAVSAGVALGGVLGV